MVLKNFIRYVIILSFVGAVIFVGRYLIYAIFFWNIDEWQRFLLSALGIAFVYFVVVLVKNYRSR